MYKNKKWKKIVIMLCVMMNIVAMASVSYGATKVQSWDEMSNSAKEFLDKGANQNVISNDDLYGVVQPIASTLIAIGTAVLVVVTVIMGIKYMTSNPEQQGKLKQQLIGLVVSTVVIFGAQLIWALIYNLMKGF